MVSFFDKIFNRVHKCKYYGDVALAYRVVASGCHIYTEGGDWYTSYPKFDGKACNGIPMRLALFNTCMAIVKQRYTRPFDDYMPDELQAFIWSLEDPAIAKKYF